MIQDKVASGFLAWSPNLTLYLAPPKDHSPFTPWKAGSEIVPTLRAIVCQESFWKRLEELWGEESAQSSITYDSVAFVKSVCEFCHCKLSLLSNAKLLLVQVLEDECLPLVKPIIMNLLSKIDQNKQRAAAELLAGVIGGI
jgi:proteasome activator subunit 4